MKKGRVGRPSAFDDALKDFLGEGSDDAPPAHLSEQPPPPISEEEIFEEAWQEAGLDKRAAGEAPPLMEFEETVEAGEAGPTGSEEPAGAGEASAAFEEEVIEESASPQFGDAEAAADDSPTEEHAAEELAGRASAAGEEPSAVFEEEVLPPEPEPERPPARRRSRSVPPPVEAQVEVEAAPPRKSRSVPPPVEAQVEVEAAPSRKSRSVPPPAEAEAMPPRKSRSAPPPVEAKGPPVMDHATYRREAQSLARRGKWKEFAALTAQMIEEAPWAALPEARSSLLGDLARIYRDRLKDVEAATEAYRRLAAIDPANHDALEYLAARYREREDWRALHDLYGAAVEATWDPDQRLEWTREAAAIATDRLRSVDLTIAAWERLWRLGDGADVAVRELSDVYRKARRWDRLAGFLAEQAERREGAARIVAWRELAEAYLSGLRDHEQAAEVLQKILAGDENDVIALLGMARVLARRKDWPALAALGARPLDHVQRAAALDFRRLVADALWSAGELDTSIAVHELVLALDPEDPDALRAKEEYFTRTGRSEALVKFLAARAEAAAEEAVRAELLARAARLAQEMDNLREAAALWERRAQLGVGRLETFQALAELYERLGEPEGVARALEGQLALTRRPATRVELLRRMGEHYAHRLGDDTRAEACWKDVLSFLPDDAKTRDELVALLRRRGDFEALDRVLAAQAARAADPAVALEFWRAAAQNIEQNIYDPKRAVRAWWRVLDLTPDDGPMWHGFVGHHRNLGAARELIAALEAELRVTPDAAARAPLALELARLWEQEQSAAGAAAVYERLLRWSPTEATALEAVARLGGAAEAGTAIGAFDVASASLEAPAVAERIALLRRGLALLPPEDKLGRFYGLRRILWLSGRDPQVLEEVVRAAAEAGAWKDLAAVYLELAAGAEDAAVRAGYQRELARVYEQREGDLVRAFLVLQSADLQAPREAGQLEELARLAEATGRHEDLLALLDVAARAGAEPAARREALRRRAAVCETRLGDAERAFHEWVRILRLDPRDGEALDNARRLAAARALWRPLDALYGELWDRAETTAERIALARARHALHAEQLGDPSGALDQLLVIYRLDPEQPGLFEQLQAAADALGAWGRLLPVLEARVRAAGAAADADQLCRVAALQEEKRQDRERAFELYAEAFVLRPSRTDLREVLERLAQATGRWDWLAFAFRLAAARTEDREQALALYRRLTAVYGEALQRPGEALDCHQRILQLQPGALDSLEVLIEHHRGAGNWRELRDRLQQWIAHGPAEPAARVPRWLEIARLSREHLADPETALAAYAQVMEADPANEEAAQGVRSLTEGPIEPPLELRRLRLELAHATPERRAEILLTCARIQEEQLDDPPGAIATLRELLAETGPGGPAFEPLSRLLREQQAWLELIDLLEARAAALPETAARLAALEATIQVAHEHPEVATPEVRERLYRKLLADRPGDMEVRRQLLSVYRDAGRQAELVDALRETLAQLPAGSADNERQWLESQLVRALDLGLGQLAEAEALLNERLKRAPDDEDALLHLASIKRRRGDFAGWLGLRQKHARKLPPAQAALAFCHLAEACDETPKQETKVPAFYREARTLDGGCVPATKALQAIGRRTKNWREAAALLPEAGEKALSWPERAARLKALGDAAGGDAAAAQGWYWRAVAVDPDHYPAWDALARLAADRGDHAGALLAHRRALAAFERSVAPEPGRLAEHAQRI
ncbi:MAG: hypothetical protein GYA57_13360, partial [Myxococcales bacterium]|nr:hypothetical protein [Myxococcales bacterium]